MPMMKGNEIVIFETADKSISLPVMIENESVWLNRGQIAELFERDIKTIGKHINNALKEELSEQNGPVKKREFVFSQAPVSFSGQTERYYYNS